MLSASVNGQRRKRGTDRSHSDEESNPDLKAAVGTLLKSGRKSVNRLVEKTIDAANIPLPDSPLV